MRACKVFTIVVLLMLGASTASMANVPLDTITLLQEKENRIVTFDPWLSKIVSELKLGNNPISFSHDVNLHWLMVPDEANHQVLLYDRQRQKMYPLWVGMSPRKIIAKANTAYVINNVDQTLSVLNLQLKRVQRNVALQGKPYDMFMTADEKSLYVFLENRELVIINLKKLTVQGHMRLSFLPKYFVSGFNQQKLYLASEQSIWMLNLQNAELEPKAIDLAWPIARKDMKMRELLASGNILVPTGKQLMVIDRDSDLLMGVIKLKNQARELVYNNDLSRAYISYQRQSYVDVIDMISLARLAHLELGVVPRQILVQHSL